jgi:hypothetical protein
MPTPPPKLKRPGAPGLGYRREGKDNGRTFPPSLPSFVSPHAFRYQWASLGDIISDRQVFEIRYLAEGNPCGGYPTRFFRRGMRYHRSDSIQLCSRCEVWAWRTAEPSDSERLFADDM